MTDKIMELAERLARARYAEVNDDDMRNWFKRSFIDGFMHGFTDKDNKKQAFLGLIKNLDGFCAVNLAEPSPGDLERVHNAYKRERELRIELQSQLAFWEKESTLWTNQAAEIDLLRETLEKIRDNHANEFQAACAADLALKRNKVVLEGK